MKYSVVLLFVLLGASYHHLTYTRIGCLAKSQDLQQPFDTKSYHLVACTCDCAYHEAKGKYSPARNQCLECYHTHDPQPMIFVRKIMLTAMKQPQNTYENPQSVLQHLINRYRRQNLAIFDK